MIGIRREGRGEIYYLLDWRLLLTAIGVSPLRGRGYGNSEKGEKGEGLTFPSMGHGNQMEETGETQAWQKRREGERYRKESVNDDVNRGEITVKGGGGGGGEGMTGRKYNEPTVQKVRKWNYWSCGDWRMRLPYTLPWGRLTIGMTMGDGMGESWVSAPSFSHVNTEGTWGIPDRTRNFCSSLLEVTIYGHSPNSFLSADHLSSIEWTNTPMGSPLDVVSSYFRELACSSTIERVEDGNILYLIYSSLNLDTNRIQHQERCWNRRWNYESLERLRVLVTHSSVS